MVVKVNVTSTRTFGVHEARSHIRGKGTAQVGRGHATFELVKSHLVEQRAGEHVVQHSATKRFVVVKICRL